MILPVRVLFVVDETAELAVRRQMTLLAEQLPTECVHCEIVGTCRRRIATSGVDGVAPVAIVPVRGAWDVFGLWRLRRVVQAFRPQVIHFWDRRAARLGLRGSVGLRGIKRTVEFAALCQHPLDFQSAQRRSTAANMLRHAVDAVICPSASAARYLVERGWAAHQVRTIPFAVELADDAAALRPPIIALRQRLLAEFGWPNDTRLVVGAGPLIPAMNVKELIWAFDLLRAVVPTARLLILGDGPQLAVLREFAAGQDAAQHVRFLVDVRRVDPPIDEQSVVACGDVFWTAARTIAPPPGVLDAMAAGVPVVAATAPGIEGLIVDRQSGCVVRPDNRADFAQAVRELCQDSNLARRIRTAAQQHVRQFHDPRQVAQQYAALYAELVGHSASTERQT